jgi:branched-chain amino acid transport system ATP-binding protein
MADSAALLRTEGLTKYFGGLTAVAGVDFTVAPGQLRAVIGPNGAGKTTFFNLLTGLLPPSAGRIVFRGEEITGLPAHRVARKGIARTLQVTSLFPGLTVHDNVWVAAQARRRFFNPFVHFSRLRDVERKTRDVLELIGLDKQADELASNLSHGDQRLLEIGLALSTNPALLLLDEPTAGLGPQETAEIARTIKTFAEGTTVIIVEHDMDVVMSLADTITVLDQGRILAEGSPEEIRQSNKVREAYLGVE